jgi:ABC-type branched-subunit amino acid transport system substrate-binding protein
VVNNRISQMGTNICAAQPAVVLFAGRGQDLAQLVRSLADRPCLDRHITIVSGDDITNTPYAQLRQGLASDVTVEYAGVAHPAEWDGATGGAAAKGLQGFTTFDSAFTRLFGRTPLTDGNTMMSYDAVLTAVSAIRLTDQRQPGPKAVDSELAALHGYLTVLGASGPLAFSADYDTGGGVGSNPIGKAIPILRLAPNGDPTVVAVKWPEGQPKAY